MIELTVNGDVQTLEQPVTLAEYLTARDIRSGRVVIERNGVIVPRDGFDDVTIADGDVLEIVQMMAGG